GIGETVGTMAFDPRGKLLAAGIAWGGDLKVFRIPSMRELATIPIKGTHQLSFSPDGALLAVASAGAERGDDLALWEVAGKRDRCHVRASGPLAFSPDGEHL